MTSRLGSDVVFLMFCTTDSSNQKALAFYDALTHGVAPSPSGLVTQARSPGR